MELKEIYNKIAAEHQAVFDSLSPDGLRAFIDTLKIYGRIFVIGVGREGMAVKAFAMRLMHMGKTVHWIWDDTTPAIGTGDLLLAVLGDGEIGHIHYVCERAKEQGAKLLVITGSPSGKTAKDLADQVLFLPAAVYRGRDTVVPSVQPMGNLFEQCLLIMLDIVVIMLVDEGAALSFDAMAARHRNVE